MQRHVNDLFASIMEISTSKIHLAMGNEILQKLEKDIVHEIFLHRLRKIGCRTKLGVWMSYELSITTLIYESMDDQKIFTVRQ